MSPAGADPPAGPPASPPIAATAALGLIVGIGLGLTGIPTPSLGCIARGGLHGARRLAVRGLALERFPRLRGIERPAPAGW